MIAKVALRYLLGPEIPSTHMSGNHGKGSKIPDRGDAKAKSFPNGRGCPSCVIWVTTEGQGLPISGIPSQVQACAFSTIHRPTAPRPVCRKADKPRERRNVDKRFDPLHRALIRRDDNWFRNGWVAVAAIVAVGPPSLFG